MKGKEKKVPNKKEGYVLILLLVFMVFLLVGAGIVAYANYRNLQTFKATENSIKALRIAQSGLEEAAVILYNDTSKCDTYFPRNKPFAGGNYTVTCNSTSKELTSCGYFRQAVRCVVASFASTGGDFVPFMVKNDFKLENFSSVGSGKDWEDANFTAGNLDLSDDVFNNMKYHGFNFLPDPPSYIPLVKDANMTELFPEETDCTCGSYESSLTAFSIKNCIDNFCNSLGNCNITICANSINIDSTIDLPKKDTNVSLTIAAKNDITIKKTAKFIHASGTKPPNVNLAILTQGNLEVNGSLVYITGKTVVGNLLVYAKGDIITSDPGYFVHFTGPLDTPGNAMVLTEGEIIDNKGNVFIDITAKKDVNVLVWADRGVNSTSKFFDSTGSNQEGVRNFSIIIGNGSGIFDKWHFTGSAKRSGLTEKEIIDLCENGESYGLASSIREVYCKLENIIKNGGSGSIKLSKIRIY